MPSTAPTAMPPKKSRAKDTAASAAEKAPVRAAAMANWKATTPDASLMSDSPASSVDWRGFRPTREPSAPTAAASVGARAAAQAKAAARGMDGTNQCGTKPTTSTVSSTSPTASEKMAPLFSQSARRLMLRASSNSSGAMNSTRNSSAGMSTP